MEKKPLVSVIIPCHNSSAYLFRLLDSLLSQTYPNMEIYAVDNDSKDDTADIIKGYIPKFEEKGYSAYYIHQDDLGPSAAMQTGFKYIKGDYLIMPDSDDWYSKPTSVESFIDKFLSLPDEYAIIRTQLQLINEEDMQPIRIVYEGFPVDDPGTLFEDCLLGKNGYNYAPIDYMVKVSALREMTGMKIYNAYNTGQQRQICLPLYYRYKAWTIAEPLACYLVRKNSISHGDYAKYETRKKLHKGRLFYITSIINSIKSMPEKDRQRYTNLFMQGSAKEMLYQADDNDRDDLKLYINEYVKFGGNRYKILYDLYYRRFKIFVRKFIKI